MSEVNMPKLSDTMEEGTVLAWKVQDGAEVKRGDVLAEIESDKASFEIEAEADGVLRIVVDKGSPVPVGQKIATIGEAAEPDTKASEAAEPDAKASEAAAEPDAKAAPDAAVQAAKAKPAGAEAAGEEEAAEKPGADAPADAAEAPAESAGAAAEAPEAPPARPEAPPKQQQEEPARAPLARAEVPGEEVKASPLARRLAAEMKVDLSGLKGSGPGGRIVKEDVLAAGKASPAAPATGVVPAAPPRPAPRPRSGADVEIEEPTRMQATIAKRMVASKTTVPHFYVTVEARVDEAVSLRRQLKDNVPGAERVTMTDMLVRACALALVRFPEVNASWVDSHFERKRAVNIGLAVAPESGLGLLVPVVHDCDRKDLVQISIESRQVIERARSGRPSPGDLDGGTFSISNLGMFGVDEFNAIINPPESGILAVGAIRDAPVVEAGRVVPGKLMRMTLSVDHRVFYGATAAQFMAEVKRLLENPVTLVVPAAED